VVVSSKCDWHLVRCSWNTIKVRLEFQVVYHQGGIWYGVILGIWYH